MADYRYDTDRCPDKNDHAWADRCYSCGYRSVYACAVDAEKWKNV